MRPTHKPLPSPLPNNTIGSITQALIDTVGAFCAYCEVPIWASPMLEDKRSAQPLLKAGSANWQYLMLICTDCLTNKSAAVTTLSDYLWPDLDTTFSLDDNSPFHYVWRDVSVIDTTLGDNPATSTQEVLCIEANSTSKLATRAQKLIDLYSLNSSAYDGQQTVTLTWQNKADPRLFNRTRAGQRAREAAQQLQQVRQNTSLAKVADLLSRNITAMAVGSGFWSAWVKVFWDEFQDADLIQKLFVQTSRQSGYTIYGYQARSNTGPYFYFPGTAFSATSGAGG